jgi:hypothetical protein
MKRVFPLQRVLLQIQIRPGSTKENIHEQTLTLISYECLTYEQFSNVCCDEKKMKG